MPRGSDTRELISTLRGFDTFAGCDKADIEALVEAGSLFSLPSGWPLVQEGIPADAVYVLTEGQARVFHQREQIADIGVGDLVGEMALLKGGQRSATVTSASRVAGLRVEYDKLKPVLTKRPKLASAFEAVYSAHHG